MNLQDVTRETILQYKQDLLDKGLSSLTVGGYITVVRKFYAWCEVSRLYPNIAQGVKSPRREQAFRKSPLTSEQATALLNYFELQPRDFAICSLLLRTGIRTIEAIRANVSDLSMKGGQNILYIQGKGRTDRTDYVVLAEKCKRAISDYLGTRGRVLSGDPLFTSVANCNPGGRLTTHAISNAIRRGLKAIGLNDRAYTTHSLRHTCAVSLLRAGGTIHQAKSVLRHSSVSQQRYI